MKEGIAAGSANSLPAAGKALGVRARDLMSTTMVVLRNDQSLREAIRILVDKKLSGAPVVDSERKLVGVISEFDCMKAVIEATFHHDGEPGMRSIDELMSRDVLSVDPDTDVYTIAHLFIMHRIRRVPVVDRGELVGLVSRRDVLVGISTLVT